MPQQCCRCAKNVQQKEQQQLYQHEVSLHCTLLLSIVVVLYDLRWIGLLAH